MASKSLKTLLSLAWLAALPLCVRAQDATGAAQPQTVQTKSPKNGSLTKHQSHKAHKSARATAVAAKDAPVHGKPKGQAPSSGAPAKASSTPSAK